MYVLMLSPIVIAVDVVSVARIHPFTTLVVVIAPAPLRMVATNVVKLTLKTTNWVEVVAS